MRIGNSSMRRVPVPAGNRKFPIGVQHVAPPVWFGYTPQVPTGRRESVGAAGTVHQFLNSAGNQREASVLDRVLTGFLTIAVAAGMTGLPLLGPGSTGGSGAKRATTMEGPRRVRPL